MDEIVFPFDDSTWIIADTHFFHANIGRYCSRPDGWQDLIIENWNHFIQPEDVVFHLGDLALGKKEDAEALVPLLNGKMYMMRGNHDRRSIAFYQALGITLVKDPYRTETASGMRLDFLSPPYRSAATGDAQSSWTYPQQSRPGIGTSTCQSQHRSPSVSALETWGCFTILFEQSQRVTARRLRPRICPGAECSYSSLPPGCAAAATPRPRSAGQLCCYGPPC